MIQQTTGQQLMETLRIFLREFDAETRERLLWEWLTAHIYFRAENISGKEASESLFFYEQLMNTLNYLESVLNQNTNT
jgi:hypothetical protein